MRPAVVLALVGLLCLGTTGCTKISVTPDFNPAVLQSVSDHTLSIVTIYAMNEEEWAKRIQKRVARVPIKNWPERFQEITPLPLKVTDAQGKVVRFLAYIGSATILKENYAISVSHLFSHEEGTYGYVIKAFKYGMDRPIDCELICRGDIDANWVNDYSLIRLKEDLGLPGLKISRVQPPAGARVIFTGSVGGLAWFTRFGYLTSLEWYFRVPTDGKLHLSTFGPVKFMVLYPGGPGDSGGSVKNLSGEIIGIMYCGIELYAEDYIMINPTELIWQFLKTVGLERLGGQNEFPEN